MQGLKLYTAFGKRPFKQIQKVFFYIFIDYRVLTVLDGQNDTVIKEYIAFFFNVSFWATESEPTFFPMLDADPHLMKADPQSC